MKSPTTATGSGRAWGLGRQGAQRRRDADRRAQRAQAADRGRLWAGAGADRRAVLADHPAGRSCRGSRRATCPAGSRPGPTLIVKQLHPARRSRRSRSRAGPGQAQPRSKDPDPRLIFWLIIFVFVLRDPADPPDGRRAAHPQQRARSDHPVGSAQRRSQRRLQPRGGGGWSGGGGGGGFSGGGGSFGGGGSSGSW